MLQHYNMCSAMWNRARRNVKILQKTRKIRRTSKNRRALLPTPNQTSRICEPKAVSQAPLTHLENLEAEAIHIMREAVAEADNPVMLYSIGKDSSVMLRLAL